MTGHRIQHPVGTTLKLKLWRPTMGTGNAGMDAFMITHRHVPFAELPDFSFKLALLDACLG